MDVQMTKNILMFNRFRNALLECEAEENKTTLDANLHGREDGTPSDTKLKESLNIFHFIIQ